MSRAILFAVLLLGHGLAVRADFQGSTHMMPFDEDTIAYSKTVANDAVMALQKRIDTGEVTLKFEDGFGYIRSLLKELKVSESSQMLVFSKTSLQRERISPQNPRSIFFSDEIYVGFIPGAPLMEFATVDPKLGGVFYSMEQKKTERPKFVRNDQCLECHASAKTMGVPGHLVRSFATDEAGIVDLASGTSLVNHRTPLADRWGGWYVTGKHGDQLHRGNLIGAAAFERQLKEPNYLGNVTDLSRFFEVSRYLRNQSDVLALMLLEHQAHMHNFLTRLQYESTIAIQQYSHVNYLKNTVTAFLKYLLFTEEIQFPSPITGSPEFAAHFASLGPRDKKGRSLRDLEMQTHLFKYPCSYLIYSPAFDALPKLIKSTIYKRLAEVLSGKDTGADFQGLTPETRLALNEILLETKPDFAEFSKQRQNRNAN